jgi:hypothetical protein
MSFARKVLRGGSVLNVEEDRVELLLTTELLLLKEEASDEDKDMIVDGLQLEMTADDDGELYTDENVLETELEIGAVDAQLVTDNDMLLDSKMDRLDDVDFTIDDESVLDTKLEMSDHIAVVVVQDDHETTLDAAEDVVGLLMEFELEGRREGPL